MIYVYYYSIRQYRHIIQISNCDFLVRLNIKINCSMITSLSSTWHWKTLVSMTATTKLHVQVRWYCIIILCYIKSWRGVPTILNGKNARGADSIISPTPNPPRLTLVAPCIVLARSSFFNWSILQDPTDPPREETIYDILYATRDWRYIYVYISTLFSVIFFITQ